MIFTKIMFPASVYLFKVSNRNTGIRRELFKVKKTDTRTTLTLLSNLNIFHILLWHFYS